jgi:hypothetical protein
MFLITGNFSDNTGTSRKITVLDIGMPPQKRGNLLYKTAYKYCCTDKNISMFDKDTQAF